MVIDWERAEALRAEIGEDDFDEVAALFLQECDEAVSAMIRAGAAGPESLHFLKGAALNLGLAELAGLCARGEADCAAGRPPDLAALAAAYGRARVAFLSRAGLSAAG